MESICRNGAGIMPAYINPVRRTGATQSSILTVNAAYPEGMSEWQNKPSKVANQRLERRPVRIYSHRTGRPGKLLPESLHRKKPRSVIQQVGIGGQSMAGGHYGLDRKRSSNTESRRGVCEKFATCQREMGTSVRLKVSPARRAEEVPLTKWFESHKMQPYSTDTQNVLSLPHKVVNEEYRHILGRRQRARHELLTKNQQLTNDIIKTINFLSKEEVDSFAEEQSDREPRLGCQRIATQSTERLGELSSRLDYYTKVTGCLNIADQDFLGKQCYIKFNNQARRV